MIMKTSMMVIKAESATCLWLMLSFINLCSTLNRWRIFSIFLSTSVFTHVIFAKIMVSFICSVCYPYFITFIFFFYDVTTTLFYTSCIFGWWWYSAFPIILIIGCIVICVITSDSNPHAFYSFIKTQILNELDGQKRFLGKWLLSDRPSNGLVWKNILHGY